MSRAAQRLGPIAALLLTTLALLLGLLRHGPSCGHDFDFHLDSWIEVARAWHTGLIHPHWIAAANYGAGEPRLVFYPPASWLLGSAAGALFGWTAAPLVFTAVCVFAAGFAMQQLARQWLSPAAATVAGCMLIANPYMVFVAYERTAYGELMAAALLPLVLLLSVEPRPRIAWLGAAVAGVWLMNAPSGVMVCYLLLFLMLLRLAVERAWRPASRISAATVLGLALAGFFLVPAWWQQRWVQIAQAVNAGMPFQDSFLFGHNGQPDHDLVLHSASLIACELLAMCAVGLALWRSARRDPRLRWLGYVAAFILLLLLPVSTPLWRTLPRLAFLPFPWRWLLVLAPIAVLLLAGALAQWLPRRALPIVAALLCIVSIAWGSRAWYQVCDNEDRVSAQLTVLTPSPATPVPRIADSDDDTPIPGNGVEGTDEYVARDADNGAIAQGVPAVRILDAPDDESADDSAQPNPPWQRDAEAELPATLDIHQWAGEQRDVTITSSRAAFAVLRLMDYPAWQVKRDGTLVTTRPHRADGLLTIPIPAGRSHITVTWHNGADVTLGRIVTLVALFVWVLVYVRERRTRLQRAATP